MAVIITMSDTRNYSACS